MFDKTLWSLMHIGLVKTVCSHTIYDSQLLGYTQSLPIVIAS